MSNQKWPEDVFGPAEVRRMRMPRLHSSLGKLTTDRTDTLEESLLPELERTSIAGAMPSKHRTDRHEIPDIQPSNVTAYDEQPHGTYRKADGTSVTF